MKNKIFFAAVAFFMIISNFANAQGRYSRHNGGYNNGGYYNNGNCNNGGYYNNGNCNNGGYYNNGNCNNGGYYRNGGGGNCGNGYGRRGRWRRPANYCQPPVVYTAPVYCPPRPRIYVPRPRVRINIGF